jgi:hypothetical protein
MFRTVNAYHSLLKDAIEDREAVATESIVDDGYHYDSEWMDVDLQYDSVLSVREKTLLQHTRHSLADIDVQVCGTCH